MESSTSQGFIAQGEMGDTSELCKSEDSLPRQTHTLTHSGLGDRSTDQMMFKEICFPKPVWYLHVEQKKKTQNKTTFTCFVRVC